MFQTIKKLLRKKKKVCLLGCAVAYFENLADSVQLTDQETEEWVNLKNHPDLFFLSWGDFAKFEPSFLFNFRAKVSAKAFTRVNVSATRECESIYES